jgi:hypothetical protein
MVETPSFFIGNIMKNIFVLPELSDESLEAVLALTVSQKASYFEAMVDTFYPSISKGSSQYTDMVSTYYSCFCVEKIYRSNMFFKEHFTPIYTSTGLIRNIIVDLYYSDDELATH